MSTLAEYDDEVDKNLSASKWVLRLILVGMFFVVSTIFYWTIETDPYYVAVPVNHPEWVVCDNRVFTHSRVVNNSKTIGTIKIDRRLKNIDTGETYTINSITHEGIKSRGIETYKTTVPLGFDPGNYLYMPTAIYKINPIKTIEKPLPSQKVSFTCS